MLLERDGYTLSDDRSRIDRELVHRVLASQYWSTNIPREIVDRSIDHAHCFAIYHPDGLVAFARVITDYATFAYLADVFVVDEHRGRGLSKWLMEAILSHPELQGLRRWMLVTRDAHGLYRQFGFTEPDDPKRIMVILRPKPY
jgi:GNAT superfamily N-acetyltransferase